MAPKVVGSPATRFQLDFPRHFQQFVGPKNEEGATTSVCWQREVVWLILSQGKASQVLGGLIAPPTPHTASAATVTDRKFFSPQLDVTHKTIRPIAPKPNGWIIIFLPPHQRWRSARYLYDPDGANHRCRRPAGTYTVPMSFNESAVG